MFFRTCGPNLLVEFECFSGQVSAHVEQYQVIHIGLPEKSRPGEILGRVYLDAMTLQNPDPHVARRLVTIYEENRLALKNWLATKWRRAIHTPPPERGAQLGRIVLPQDAGVKGNGKAPLVGAFGGAENGVCEGFGCCGRGRSPWGFVDEVDRVLVAVGQAAGVLI